jgi:hypothetical protein
MTSRAVFRSLTVLGCSRISRRRQELHGDSRFASGLWRHTEDEIEQRKAPLDPPLSKRGLRAHLGAAVVRGRSCSSACPRSSYATRGGCAAWRTRVVRIADKLRRLSDRTLSYGTGRPCERSRHAGLWVGRAAWHVITNSAGRLFTGLFPCVRVLLSAGTIRREVINFDEIPVIKLLDKRHRPAAVPRAEMAAGTFLR